MTWNWQDISALSIVSVAVVYVATLVYRRLRRREAGACGGGCFGCKQAEPESQQIVTIGTSENLTVHPNKPR
ncbi:MAG: FeoB-associated Cys-rich membrane protein [Planctomycetota bacterium]|nr:FeoB-associated Cys-rich membrane protein [Planctomycetota bacterium]